MKLKNLIISLFLCINVFALDLEELQTQFVEVGEFGPISVEKLSQLETGLKDLGHEIYFEQLQEKLGLYKLEEISQYVHTCEMEDDTLGFFRRGTTWTYKMAQEFGVDLFSTNWGTEAQEKMSKAFKIYQLEHNTHYELIIEEWPIICIRPEKEFGSVLTTFAHEINHFVNQPTSAIDLEEIETEEDYLIKRLKQSGGEFEAMQVSAKIALELETYEYYVRDDLLKYYVDGNLVDPDGFASYILSGLNYQEQFINEYREGLVNLQAIYEKEKKDLVWLKNFYTQNLIISKSNVEITKNNIGVFEANLKYYQRINNQIKILETQENLTKTLSDLEMYKKSIIFYENLLTFFKDQVVAD